MRACLVRQDSGHDAQETREALLQADVDYILKWNPRRHDSAAWLATAEALNQWVTPRDGIRVATFSDSDRQTVNGNTLCERRVMQVTERTIDKHGQRLQLPMISVEGWWTTLDQQQYDDLTSFLFTRIMRRQNCFIVNSRPIWILNAYHLANSIPTI